VWQTPDVQERSDVALITYAGMPDLCSDDRLLVDALEQRGLRVRVVVWDDPSVDWSASTLAVIRSTWDYFHKPDAFLRWLRDVSRRTTLVNPASIVEWNHHKGYLRDLSERGVAVVPTAYAVRDAATALPELAARRGWREIVVKPCISGSSHLARRFGDAAAPEAQAHLDRIVATQDAMIQPYLAQVEREGERSLIYVGGAFSHAIRKAPFSPGVVGGEDKEAFVEASVEEIAFGQHALAQAGEPAVYARVDVVPVDGRSLLMELELIEPALHFRLAPGSADRFAGVLDALVQRPVTA
jgi:hypothetical protein